jgi:hypothetical protein
MSKIKVFAFFARRRIGKLSLLAVVNAIQAWPVEGCINSGRHDFKVAFEVSLSPGLSRLCRDKTAFTAGS